MSNIGLLIICFCIGIILRRTGKFPENTPVPLNGFIIYVSLPALALLHVHDIKIEMSLFYPAAMAWLLFVLGYLYFRGVARVAGLSERSVGALLLVGALGNTSFVGLPMIEAFYGKGALAIGIVADQIGTFMVLSTLGILAAAVYSSSSVSPHAIARKILAFPPFLAFAAALLLRPVEYPAWFIPILQKLGDTLTPLALVSVGFQLRLSHLKGTLKPLSLGLLYKLILGPALLALIYIGLFGARGEVVQVTIFEAAMAPMITGGIIAIDHDLDPPLVTMMIGIGIPLSFLTLPLWWHILSRFG